jgi:hypothetical protein
MIMSGLLWTPLGRLAIPWRRAAATTVMTLTSSSAAMSE